MIFAKSFLPRLMVRKLADVPMSVIAGHSLTAGMVGSALETAGRITRGHEALLLAMVPIVGWSVAQWLTDRK